MWIVKVALNRPNTFVVLAILIAIFGSLSAVRTPTDIFPNINIPVVPIPFSRERHCALGNSGYA
jgi:multidrug efflux pump subunit AcrB